MNSFESWKKSWSDIGAIGDPTKAFKDIKNCYGEPHRHHHTWTHIEEGLEEFERVGELAENPAEVIIAFAGHDLIYDVYERDLLNVEQSGDAINRILTDAGVKFSTRERINNLITTTSHIYVPRTVDQEIICDIDLAILGQGEKRYAQFEEDIRQEYKHVDWEIYRTTRAKILNRFRKRVNIYATKFFQDRYEVQAKRNLTQAILNLDPTKLI